MAARKPAPPPDAPEADAPEADDPATLAPPTLLHPPPRGYLASARPRYLWVTCPATQGGDDPAGEPFRAQIQSNLTWGEIDALQITDDLTYRDLWGLMAPYVIAWNALGRDAITGAITAVPPPATAGPDAFAAIEAFLSHWLLTELRTVHLGGAHRGKESAPPV